MGRTVEVDDHPGTCAEAGRPPNDLQQGGKGILGKAAGDFEDHGSGIGIGPGRGPLVTGPTTS
jgi:hypothetical protein